MGVFKSVFSNISSFVYRSSSEGDCLLVEISEGVHELLGYDPQKMINNSNTSFATLTYQDDKESTFQQVDNATQYGLPWDIAYRMVHAKGHNVWVRERGKGVFVDGKLTYLEGLIVSAEEEIKARTDLEQMVTDTKEANKEIVYLTGNIIKSIRALKMLSVNARIEAARSGEAGLGFTIVADEMKKLADQNAEWARVINERISDMDS